MSFGAPTEISGPPNPNTATAKHHFRRGRAATKGCRRPDKHSSKEQADASPDKVEKHTGRYRRKDVDQRPRTQDSAEGRVVDPQFIADFG